MALDTATYIAQLSLSDPVGTDKRSTADDHIRHVKTVLDNQFPNFSATSVDVTCPEINKLAGKTGAVGHLGEVGAWVAQQYFSEASLTMSATVSWDLSVAQTARLGITGVAVLPNPTNMVAGGTYIMRVTNLASATASISFGSAFLFTYGIKPTLTKSLSAVDILTFYSDGTSMYGTAILDVK